MNDDTDDQQDAVAVLDGEHAELAALFARVSSPDEDRRAVLKQLMQQLSVHIDMEKQLLVPALEKYVPGADVMVGPLMDDHDRLEHLLTLLERRKVNSPDVPGMVTEMLDIVERHITTGHDAVFPALRGALSADDLLELGRRMVSDERRMLTHSHPALPDTGPVAAVTRKVAEIVDHVRDGNADIGRTSG